MNLYFIRQNLKPIHEFIASLNIESENNSIKNAISNNSILQPHIFNKAKVDLINIINAINSIRKYVDEGNFNYFLKLFGINYLLFDQKNNINDIAQIKKLKANAEDVKILSDKFVNYREAFTRLHSQLNSANNLLNQFAFEDIGELFNEYGILEMVFPDKTEFNDSRYLKDEFDNIYLIINGYADLLGIRVPDFEIYEISKESPLSVKIKYGLKYSVIIVGIIVGITEIRKNEAERQFYREQIQKTKLVSDPAKQKEFFNLAEKDDKEITEDQLNKIVDEKINEENNKAAKNSFAKSVDRQYNFIIQGGEFNLFLGEGTKDKEEYIKLEQAKKELKQIESKTEINLIEEKNEKPAEKKAVAAKENKSETKGEK